MTNPHCYNQGMAGYLGLGDKLGTHRYFKSVANVDSTERILCTVKQHPVGIVIIYSAVLLCFTAGLAFMAILMPSVFSSSTTAYSMLALFAVIIAIIVIAIVAVATNVYNQSKLTVTDRNVIQILQQGLFDRKISQISLANVEDVSSQQRGFFANTFNFGCVKIETAGEQANFIFNFCPNPNGVAKIILDAKDDFLIATGQAGSYRNSLRPSHYDDRVNI